MNACTWVCNFVLNFSFLKMFKHLKKYSNISSKNSNKISFITYVMFIPHENFSKIFTHNFAYKIKFKILKCPPTCFLNIFSASNQISFILRGKKSPEHAVNHRKSFLSSGDKSKQIIFFQSHFIRMTSKTNSNHLLSLLSWGSQKNWKEEEKWKSVAKSN